MQKKWYVIHVMTGQEERVKRNIERRVATFHLQDKIGRVIIPTETERRYKGGKVEFVKHRVFPGYLLVEMVLDEEGWHFIRGTAGVTGFVGSQSRPASLPDHEVDTILRMAGEEIPKPRAVWHKGEVVRVKSGAFAESTGKIEEVNPHKQTVKVMLTVFGRETPVELDFSQVDKT